MRSNQRARHRSKKSGLKFTLTGSAIGVGCLLIAALILGLMALEYAIFYWLWNWIIPAVFNGPTITFWQAFGLVTLCNIVGALLFKKRS
jgi:hypothetical protein